MYPTIDSRLLNIEGPLRYALECSISWYRLLHTRENLKPLQE